MPGLLDLANVDRDQALEGFRQTAGQENQRNTANKALVAQAKAQQNQAIGSALGTGATLAAMGNPVTGAIVGGVMLLGSLF